MEARKVRKGVVIEEHRETQENVRGERGQWWSERRGETGAGSSGCSITRAQCKELEVYQMLWEKITAQNIWHMDDVEQNHNVIQ